MWVTSLGLAGEAGIFASLPFYPMFSGVPNGLLRLSPPQVHAAVHNSGVIELCRQNRENFDPDLFVPVISYVRAQTGPASRSDVIAIRS